ncbi:hypothetical protein ITJ05_16765, partial [Clostridioides difficile]|nr:hypothetical protein [Clostridioides difficile]
NSKVLSADVSAGYDPNFGEAYEKRNSAYMGNGVVLTKYTGSRGKSGCNDAELYFEEDNFDTFVERLSTMKDIDYVHLAIEHRWGQRAIRFYDLDGHIIEVGETMSSVCRRFLDSGLSMDEVAKRMDVTVEYIESVLD